MWILLTWSSGRTLHHFLINRSIWRWSAAIKNPVGISFLLYICLTKTCVFFRCRKRAVRGSGKIPPMQPVTIAEKQCWRWNLNAWIRVGGLWGRIIKILILISPTNFSNKCANILMRNCVTFQTTLDITWIAPGCSDHSKPITYLQAAGYGIRWFKCKQGLEYYRKREVWRWALQNNNKTVKCFPKVN